MSHITSSGYQAILYCIRYQAIDYDIILPVLDNKL